MDWSLKEMTTVDGSWNLNFFHHWVSEEVINKIVSVLPLHIASSFVWGASSTGCFSLKNAYAKICEGSLNPKESIWELPWKFQSPHRICFFISLTLKQRLITNAGKTRRGIESDSACGFCGHEFGEAFHIFRDYLAARSIWDKIIPDETLSRFYTRSLQEWIMGNFQMNQPVSLVEIDWSCLFRIISWRI